MGEDGGMSGVEWMRKARERKGCALLMSPRMWQGIEAHGWKESRIVWTSGKVRIVEYGWICVSFTMVLRITCWTHDCQSAVTRWEDENNESMYERYCMGTHANVVECSVTEWVKRNMLRWFNHIESL